MQIPCELLLVEWQDARKGEKNIYEGNLKSLKPIPIISIGLGYETEYSVNLAQDYFPLEDGDAPGDDAWRQWEVIPKVCISSIKRLVEK